MNEKARLEKATLDYFLEAYNGLRGTHLELKEHSDKPDFIVKDSETNQIVGIEVSHLFYDPDEAKILLGRSAEPIHNLMNSTELLATLNKLLHNKTESAQKYEFKGKMFLIVRVASPIFDKSTFDMFEEGIVIPPNVFNEIWLVFRDCSRLVWDELKCLKVGDSSC